MPEATIQATEKTFVVGCVAFCDCMPDDLGWKAAAVM
jgi:hypothetical protein